MNEINLQDLRTKIEKIDAQIIKKLAQRQKISTKIGELKASHRKKITNITREKKLMRFYGELCALIPSLRNHTSDIKRIFKIVFMISKKSQNK
jgi:chorismate mutase